MPNAVVLLSGGLDSATTLAVAKDSGYAAYALSVAYGQRHDAELAAAARVARALGAERHLVVKVGSRRLRRLRADRRDRSPQAAHGHRRRRDPGHVRAGPQHRSALARARVGRGARGVRRLHRRHGGRLQRLPGLPARVRRRLRGAGERGDEGGGGEAGACADPRAADRPEQGRDHRQRNGARRRLRPDAQLLRPRPGRGARAAPATHACSGSTASAPRGSRTRSGTRRRGSKVSHADVDQGPSARGRAARRELPSARVAGGRGDDGPWRRVRLPVRGRRALRAWSGGGGRDRPRRRSARRPLPRACRRQRPGDDRLRSGCRRRGRRRAPRRGRLGRPVGLLGGSLPAGGHAWGRPEPRVGLRRCDRRVRAGCAAGARVRPGGDRRRRRTCGRDRLVGGSGSRLRRPGRSGGVPAAGREAGRCRPARIGDRRDRALTRPWHAHRDLLRNDRGRPRLARSGRLARHRRV